MSGSVAEKLGAQRAEPLAVTQARVNELLGEVGSPRRRKPLAWTSEILPRHHFLAQLRRERLRADRSNTPLSLLHMSCQGGADDMLRLMEVAAVRKRETDIIGRLGSSELAVLLPDTDCNGGARLREKILERVSGISCSATTRTYPDQVFEGLDGEGAVSPNIYFFEANELNRPRYVRSAVKRVLDVIGASVGIVLASPLMIGVAVAVALSSPGPIIFRQSRIGRGGAPFTFYKFRSMRCDMDDSAHREYVTKLIEGNLDAVDQGDGDKPLYKIKSDPRVTAVGRFIRKTSLDELPQLFNVLRGNMSLVGPRPPLPYEVEKYLSWHLWRVLDVKPGITGLWQVEGRSRTSFDEMVRLDLRYVRETTLVQDIRILGKTVKVVFGGDGAG
jgi:lipopolysaccharide/colanic/teichoic acid biosynthesis glycosyltransferase